MDDLARALKNIAAAPSAVTSDPIATELRRLNDLLGEASPCPIVFPPMDEAAARHARLTGQVLAIQTNAVLAADDALAMANVAAVRRASGG